MQHNRLPRVLGLVALLFLLAGGAVMTLGGDPVGIRQFGARLVYEDHQALAFRSGDAADGVDPVSYQIR